MATETTYAAETEAQALIEESLVENRTVTAYPETQVEFDALFGALAVASDGDVDSAELGGAGYSGPEARGKLRVWSEDGWSVNLVRCPL